MSITTASWRSHTTGGFRLRVEAERLVQSNTDLNENRTRIRFRAFFESMATGWNMNYTFHTARNLTITLPSGIDNIVHQVPSNTGVLSANQSREIMPWTERIFPHNADGSRANFTFSASMPSWNPIGIGLLNPTTGNSSSISFITIPRQSTISNNPTWTAFSERLTINVVRQATTHSNDIRLAVRNTTATNTTDAFSHTSFTQIIGWTHFTGNSFNFNLTEAQLTNVFTAMNSATTRQVIVEIRTRNGTANNSAIIGTVQSRRGTVTAPAANTASFSNFSVNNGVTTASVATTITRVSAGTSQTGSLQTELRLRNNTTNITGWTNLISGTTGTVSLVEANLTTLRGAIATGRTLNTLNLHVRTTYNGVQVRTNQVSLNRTITFNLAPLLTTTITSSPVSGSGSLGNTTHIQGRSNAVINFPANFAPISNGWANQDFHPRRGSTNLTRVNPVTSSGSVSVTGLSTSGSQSVGIRVTDNRENTRDSMHTINVQAYSIPTFTPTVIRHTTQANTVVISGNGWRQAITGTGTGALSNQIEVRTQHRTRSIGGSFPAWNVTTHPWTTRIGADTTTVNMGATNITISDSLEAEIAFEWRDRVNTSWQRSTVLVSVSMPTLFIGSGNGRVGINALPTQDNIFDIGAETTLGTGLFSNASRSQSNGSNPRPSRQVLPNNSFNSGISGNEYPWGYTTFNISTDLIGRAYPTSSGLVENHRVNANRMIQYYYESGTNSNDRTRVWVRRWQGNIQSNSNAANNGFPANSGWSKWSVVVGNGHSVGTAVGRWNQGDLLIQTGRQLITVTANQISSATVTFAHPFDAIPNVQVTSNTSSPVVVQNVTINNVTTTGFQIHQIRTNSTNNSVEWSAIGRSRSVDATM